AQVKKGAQVIDICLADPDRDEIEDMRQFLSYVTKKVKAPLMIDSTNLDVFDFALKYSQGKAILNSINLEDGEEKFDRAIKIVKKYGAAVVVGTIDEQGMAVTRERKLEVATRSYDLLVNKYGLDPRDIIFDPLVFPVGTGDEQYIGSATETVEGIRLIKEAFPLCQTILGVSNISFGLPGSGREVLNAVFLYHCTRAGLDYAIVNSEKLERYASISEAERRLSEELLFNTNDETLATFTAFYREKKVTQAVNISTLTLEERLANYVVEGSKEGLIPDLEEALNRYAPLEVINGPLMTGMEEVGRLFNNNELIVAEVLQSAEVMKAAVAYLEPFMEKTEGSMKGKILLATVKGDVHDIGKNLVEIILSNNGFEVVNLGIKVTPEQLIQAARAEKPDAIGLSGLLVKSAQQMVITAQDLRSAGIDVPLLVGGAALTRKFTSNRIMPEYKGLVLYSRDAMDGLDIANKLNNPQEVARIQAQQEADRLAAQSKTEQKVAVTVAPDTSVRSNITFDGDVI
ncbi:MAG: dihydropteroate synthase, partial [Tumebacillaceae bacterium]